VPVATPRRFPKGVRRDEPSAETNREDSGQGAVARCRVPAADLASVSRGLDCVKPVQHMLAPKQAKPAAGRRALQARSEPKDDGFSRWIAGRGYPGP